MLPQLYSLNSFPSRQTRSPDETVVQTVSNLYFTLVGLTVRRLTAPDSLSQSCHHRNLRKLLYCMWCTDLLLFQNIWEPPKQRFDNSQQSYSTPEAPLGTAAGAAEHLWFCRWKCRCDCRCDLQLMAGSSYSWMDSLCNFSQWFNTTTSAWQRSLILHPHQAFIMARRHVALCSTCAVYQRDTDETPVALISVWELTLISFHAPWTL